MTTRLLVRNMDKTVFPVDRRTLEPLLTAYYDPYCFDDPDPNVEYMEHGTWLSKRDDIETANAD